MNAEELPFVPNVRSAFKARVCATLEGALVHLASPLLLIDCRQDDKTKCERDVLCRSYIISSTVP